MGRVHHCIQENNGLDSKLERKTFAWDALKGKDSKASGRVHRVGRVLCKSKIGKQGGRWEG